MQRGDIKLIWEIQSRIFQFFFFDLRTDYEAVRKRSPIIHFLSRSVVLSNSLGKFQLTWLGLKLGAWNRDCEADALTTSDIALSIQHKREFGRHIGNRL